MYNIDTALDEFFESRRSLRWQHGCALTALLGLGILLVATPGTGRVVTLGVLLVIGLAVRLREKSSAWKIIRVVLAMPIYTALIVATIWVIGTAFVSLVVLSVDFLIDLHVRWGDYLHAYHRMVHPVPLIPGSVVIILMLLLSADD